MLSKYTDSRFFRCCSLLCTLLLVGCSGLAKTQAPLLELREVHDFGALRIAFSPSGRLLASGGLLGDIRISSVPSGGLVRLFRGSHRPVTGLAWVDEYRLAASVAGSVRLLDIRSGEVRELKGGGTVNSLVYHASTGHLLAGTDSGVLQVYNWREPAVAAAVSLGAGISALAVDREGQHIAVAMQDKTLRLLDAKLNGVRRLESPGRVVRELRFSPGGEQLAGGGWFRLYTWQVASGEMTQRESRHRGKVASLDFSPDGKLLASMGRFTDSNIWLTDTETGDVRRRLAPGPLCGWQVRFSPDGRFLASASEDGTLRLFDLQAPYRPAVFHPLPGEAFTQ